MAPGLFHYDIEHSRIDPSEAQDTFGNKVTTIKCHGKLALQTRDQIESIFKQTPFEGRIVMDLRDVSYLDSAGLGTLIRLKLSAAKQGGVSVDYVEMTPRVAELLRITHLTDWFST